MNNSQDNQFPNDNNIPQQNNNNQNSEKTIPFSVNLNGFEDNNNPLQNTMLNVTDDDIKLNPPTNYIPDTLGLEYPVLAHQIHTAMINGYDRNELRKKLMQAEVYAKQFYKPEEIDKFLGRTPENQTELWNYMDELQTQEFVNIMKYDMSEDKVRDRLKTSQLSGFSPALLLLNPEPLLLQKAEEIAGNRVGFVNNILASVKKTISSYQQGNANTQFNEAQGVQMSMQNRNELIEEGKRIALAAAWDETLSDDDYAELGRKSLERQYNNLIQYAKTNQENSAWWAKDTHTRPPDSKIGAIICSAIENSGFTVISGLRSAIGWTLGGIPGGLLAAIYNTYDESQTEGGEAFMQALQMGKSPEEAFAISQKVRNNNMIFLPTSNYLGDWFILGTANKLVERYISSYIPGGGLLSKIVRGAVNYGLPTVASGLIEGNEELAQEYFKLNALGLDVNQKYNQDQLWEAFKMGFADSIVFSIVGGGTQHAMNKLRSPTTSGKIAAAQQEISNVQQQAYQNAMNEIKEVQQLGEQIEHGDINPDDIVREDPFVFIPENVLDDNTLQSLGIKNETLDNTGEELSSQLSYQPETNSEITNSDENEPELIAIRKSTWDNFVTNNPEQAQSLQEYVSEGTQKVTAKEDLKQKVENLKRLFNKNPEIRKIRDNTEQQLINAGRSKEEAGTLADITAAITSTLSNISGVNPEEIVNIIWQNGTPKSYNLESHNQMGGIIAAQKLDEAEGTTIRMDNLRIAEQMRKNKKTEKQIWLATGWTKRPDGNWAFEFKKYGEVKSDVFNKLKEKEFQLDTPIKLSDIFDAPEAFTAYPQLKNMEVKFDKTLTSGGGYDGIGIISRPYSDIAVLQTVLIHETQHAIQVIEGFEGGAAVDLNTGLERGYVITGKITKKMGEYLKERELKEFKDFVEHQKDLNFTFAGPEVIRATEVLKAAELYAKTYGDSKEADKILSFISESETGWKKWTIALKYFKRLMQGIKSGKIPISYNDFYYFKGGEIDARNAEARAKMTEEDRLKKPPSKTQDRPFWLSSVEGNYNIIGHYEEKLGVSPENIEIFKQYFKKLHPYEYVRIEDLRRDLIKTKSMLTDFDNIIKKLRDERIINLEGSGEKSSSLSEEEIAKGFTDENGYFFTIFFVFPDADIDKLTSEPTTEGYNQKYTSEYNNANAQNNNDFLITESGRSIEEADASEMLLTQDGSKTLGIIDEQTANSAGIQAGGIQIDVKGLRHTAWGEHREQILKAGYNSIENFLLDVVNNYQKIYQGAHESLLLVKPLSKNNAVAAIELTPDIGDNYLIQTGWIIRDRGLKNKKLLFARSESLANSPSSDEVSRSAPNTLGEADPNAILESNINSVSLNSETVNNNSENINANISWEKDKSIFEAPSIVTFLSSANKSSGFHELGHHILRTLIDLSSIENVNPQLINDVDTIFKNAGITREQWDNDIDNAREKAHEFFAKSFEAYLAEGKSPNKELQDAFSRIRIWLIQVYHDVIQALDIELNDEMRDIFNRILSTPEQVSDNMTMSELATVEDAARNAIQKTQNLIAELEKNETDFFNFDEYDFPENDVNGWIQSLSEHDLKSQQFEYNNEIINAIKDLGGLRFQDTVHDLGKDLARDLLKKLPGIFRKQKGKNKLAIDIIQQNLEAMGYPFHDTNDLINWLSNNSFEKPKRPAPIIEINDTTFPALMNEFGGEGAKDYINERKRYLNKLIASANDEFNKAKSRSLQLEADIARLERLLKTSKGQKNYDEINSTLRENKNNLKKALSDITVSEYDLRELYREQESIPEYINVINDVLSRNDSEQEPQSEMPKWLREFGLEEKQHKPQEQFLTLAEAMKRGYQMLEKYSRQAYNAGVKAERQKTTQRINALKQHNKEMREQQAYRKRIRTERKKMLNQIKRMSESKNIIWNAQQEIKDTLSQYTAAQFSDMSFADVLDLYTNIRNIYNRGREELAAKKAITDEKIEAIREKIRTSMLPYYTTQAPSALRNRREVDKQYKGLKGKAEKFIDWVHAKTLGAQRFFDLLDGRKDFKGTWVQVFVDDANKARDLELQQKFKRLAAFEQKMLELGLTPQDLTSNREVEGVPGRNGLPWTVDQIMSVYAGMKNENSRNAILYGNFAEAGEQAEAWAAKVIQSLNDNEKALADYIIQDYEDNFERINKALIDTYNKGMQHEEYYTPMRRIEYTSRLTEINPDAGDISKTSGMNNVEKGFSISRVNFGEKKQSGIDLGLVDIWYSQVEAQEHTAAFGELINNLRRILLGKNEPHSPTIRQMVKQVYGNNAWSMVKNYFNILANDDAQNSFDILNDVSNWMGRNMSIAYLAGNIGTMLKQLGSLPRALPFSGPVALLNSIRQFLTKGQNFLEECYELDPQLRDRKGEPLLRALRESKENQNPYYQSFLSLAMEPIGWFDRAASTIVFKAVYDANIKQGLSHQDSVKEAQRVVLLTQPPTNLKDKPLLWQQHGLARMLMMFTNDMSQTLGITLYDLNNAVRNKNVPKILYTLLGLTLAASLIKGVSFGLPDNPDDPEEWFKWFVSAFSEQEISSIPIIGKEAVSLWNLGTTYYSGESPFIAPLAKFVKGAKGLWDDNNNNDERAYFDLIEAFSLLSPFPATAVKRIFGTGSALDKGDVVRALKTMVGMRNNDKKIQKAAGL